MRSAELRSRLTTYSTELAKREGARDSLQESRAELLEEVKSLDEMIGTTEKALFLLQQYGETQQRAIAEKMESVVTKGLQAVFQNDTMEFKITYSETKKGDKKKTPEISMSVWYEANGNMVEGNIRNSFGGGLSVVVSVLLRIVIAIHLSNRVRPIILLDEALKDLSPDQNSYDERIDGYRTRMATFLRKLVDETNLQLILVSHEEEYSELADVHHKFVGGIGLSSKVKTTVNEGPQELEDING